MAGRSLETLVRLGQSPWLDFISREIVRGGQLERWIGSLALRGVTSNPAIFEKAISSGRDYDGSIRALSSRGLDAAAIFEGIALEDVGEAADVFRSHHETWGGGDGFVSLEVSPRLARDTEGSVAEARRLWKALARPNAMIKIPGTAEGLPAIQTLVADGVNVNVTLLFGLERYREVAEAYLAGLEARAARELPLGGVHSVASFFLSRIDSRLDPRLERIGEQGGRHASLARRLVGEVAIASARRAYAIYGEVFGSERFRALAARGAHPQRLLWASTSTKNPKYSDTKYVEPLIGPDTVNTMPLDTLRAYDDHGQPAVRLRDDPDGAQRVLDSLPELGVDLRAETDALEEEGIVKFVEPYDALLRAIEVRRREV
jgi:transaldolase